MKIANKDIKYHIGNFFISLGSIIQKFRFKINNGSVIASFHKYTVAQHESLFFIPMSQSITSLLLYLAIKPEK